MKELDVSFPHGMGDTTYFAHSLPLYMKRGYNFKIVCEPNKQIFYAPLGVEVITSGSAVHHPWPEIPNVQFLEHESIWKGSKPGYNLSREPMPNIGEVVDLWDEYCQVQLDITPHVPMEAKDKIHHLTVDLPRPLILLHTKGNNFAQQKNIPDSLTLELYKHLIDLTDGTIVLLDWDNRVPRLASFRIRHIQDDWDGLSTEEFFALMDKADLLVGIDSGPLHAVRYTKTPAIGLWLYGHHPRVGLPRENTLHIVSRQEQNKYARIPYHIIECNPDDPHIAFEIARICRQMLSTPKYLSRQQIAADVQLQNFVNLTRSNGNHLGGFPDRHRGFDTLLGEATRRFSLPIIVETGCIRSQEDWMGAGFSTYLLGFYCSKRGGKLYSIDCSEGNCNFARTWTKIFGDSVQIVQNYSTKWLRDYDGRIDIFYQDSVDTDDPNHAEENFKELQAGLPKLHDRSIIAYDDTVWSHGKFIGKGAESIPWLLDRGWRVLYAGYQVVLVKRGN